MNAALPLAPAATGPRGGGTSRAPGWLLPPNQLLYASGAFGLNIFHQTLTLWLVYFYAPPAESGRPTLVPMAVLGGLLALGRIVEGFDDPAIGHWSDVTHSRWGRRLPFMVAGAPLLVLAFVLVWTPPVTQMPWTAVYAFVLLQVYFFFSTLVYQPYEAVLAEITRAPPDRVRVSSWKVIFGMLGTAVGLVGSGLLIGALGFPGMAIVLGLVAGGSLVLSARGVRNLPHAPAHERRLPLWSGLLLTLRNDQFVIFVCSEVLFFLGLNMLTLLVPYFVTVVLGRSEALVSVFTGVFALAALASLPLVNWLTARRGKAFAYRVSMAALVVLLPGLSVVGLLPGVDPTLQGLVYIAVLGVPMSVLLVLPNPFVADIADDDARRTGLRREGVYFGAEETFDKLGFALSTLIFGVVLDAFGFSPENSLGIRLIGPIAGLGVLLGLILFVRGYRLPDQVPIGSSLERVAGA